MASRVSELQQRTIPCCGEETALKLTLTMWLIAIWFAISVAAASIWNVAFYLWLKKKGVTLPYLSGIPGYKEVIYRRWRRREGVRPGVAGILMYLLLANVIVATIMFWIWIVPATRG